MVYMISVSVDIKQYEQAKIIEAALQRGFPRRDEKAEWTFVEVKQAMNWLAEKMFGDITK